MSENTADIVRKSLDIVDKRQKKFLWLGIILSIIAVWFLVTMAFVVDERPQTLEKISFQIMMGFDGLGMFITALCLYIMGITQRNTRIILKAIETASNSKSEN